MPRTLCSIAILLSLCSTAQAQAPELEPCNGYTFLYPNFRTRYHHVIVYRFYGGKYHRYCDLPKGHGVIITTPSGPGRDFHPILFPGEIKYVFHSTVYRTSN
jgi:hypothetical protein